MKNYMTENDLYIARYLYLGELPDKKQLWRQKDLNDLIVYDPVSRKIVWVQHNQIKAYSKPVKEVDLHRINVFGLLFGDMTLNDVILTLQSIAKI